MIIRRCVRCYGVASYFGVIRPRNTPRPPLRRGDRPEHSSGPWCHDVTIQSRGFTRRRRHYGDQWIRLCDVHIHVVPDVPEESQRDGAERIAVPGNEDPHHELVTEHAPPPVATMIALLVDIIERNRVSHVGRNVAQKLGFCGKPGEVRVSRPAADQSLSPPYVRVETQCVTYLVHYDRRKEAFVLERIHVRGIDSDMTDDRQIPRAFTADLRIGEGALRTIDSIKR